MGRLDVSSVERAMESLTITNRYIILALAVVCSSVGHILFKLSANTLKTLTSFWSLALEPTFIFAIGLYGITTLIWIWCLQEIPLSRAYLFLSLSYVFIPLLAWVIFGEVPNLKYLYSSACILMGIALAVV
jgi:drug/metabolite transporter (DMT)-like permease